MQVRPRARARGRRTGVIGVIALVAVLGVLLSACEPGAWRERYEKNKAAREQRAAASASATPVAASTPQALGDGQPATLVALGDSYSTGEGNPPFDTVAGGCDRSSDAWPRLLPGLMPGTTVQLLACSGATTKALTGPFKNQPAQADQLRALGTAPTVVTITIGGNDAGFGSTIASCFLWRCFWDGRDDRVRAVVDDQLPGLLQTSYAAVRAAAPNARIVVVGYPKIFPQRTSAACPWMNSTERSQLASLNGDLNRVIRRAASKADLEYISADNALKGHEMCTSEPWVYPVTISTAGSRDSAHPTPAGEQAIAKIVQTYLAKPR